MLAFEKMLANGYDAEYDSQSIFYKCCDCNCIAGMTSLKDQISIQELLVKEENLLMQTSIQTAMTNLLLTVC